MALDNPDVQAISARARAAAQTFQWQEVQHLAEQLMAAVPENAEGYFLNGLAESARQRPRLARDHFAKALQYDAQRYDAAIELADKYASAQQNCEAFALLERYSAAAHNSPRYLNLAATVYVHIGLPAKALPLCERALQLQPGIELFAANLASCCVAMGDLTRAKSLYRALLDHNPQHRRNHFFYAKIHKATDESHIAQMHEVLRRDPKAQTHNIYLYYALGKEYEDLERWDDAFAFFNRAGEAVSSVSDYRLEDDVNVIDTIIRVCSSTWLNAEATGREALCTDAAQQTPVFIVGLPRTGTTLTERILASHSSVYSLDETQFMPMAVRKASGAHDRLQLSPEIIERAAAAEIAQVAKHYLGAASYRMEQRPYFIDKLPYNFLYLGFIAKAFPQAKIIYLDRHPLDACFSMYKQVFTWAYKFSYDIRQLGHYYLQHVRLLAHWRKLLGPRLVEVSYEAIVAQPEPQVRALLKNIGLEFEADCLNFHQLKRASSTASSVQVRSKIYSGSVGRWRHYQQQLQPMQAILTEAGVKL